MNRSRELIWALLLTGILLGANSSAPAGDIKATLDSADGTTAFIVLDTNSNELFRIDSKGRVGVGTNAPTHKLSVAGVVESASGGFRFPDGTLQSTAAGGGGNSWQVGGMPIFSSIMELTRARFWAWLLNTNTLNFN